MNYNYLARAESYKGKDKLVWSDSGKSARIHRYISNQEEKRYFNNNPSTLQEAIRTATIFKPIRTGLAKRVEVSFLEPELYLDTEKPYFTVQYVEAKR
ncbi:MAG: hypothetical protein KAS15_00630 [Nanoarchaeota archaeon]|nr:hypothetical protein [Nanoarchaeota archaeon]